MGSNIGYDYAGRTFGRLVVLKDTGKRNPKKGKIWLCRCECKNLTEATTVHLNRGNKRSCGCLATESRKKTRKRIRSSLSRKKLQSNDFKKEISKNKKLKNELPIELENVPSKMVANGLFQVFRNGRIFRVNRKGKIECPLIISNGYTTVTGMVGGKQKHFYVHRLLADAFVPNPKNKPLVIFKDGNKENLSLDNLMHATQSELISLSYKSGRLDPFVNGVNCKECGSRRTRSKSGICSSCKSAVESKEKWLQTRKNRKESVAYLIDNIELLTSKQRETVGLRAKGMTYKQIACELGKTRQAIEKSIRSAEQRVKRLKSKRSQKVTVKKAIVKKVSVKKTNRISKLKVLRVMHGLNQSDIADLLKITAPSYSRKERGILPFTLNEGEKLALLFDEEFDEIFVS